MVIAIVLSMIHLDQGVNMFKNLLNDGNVVRKQIVITPEGGVSNVVRADKNNKSATSVGTYQIGREGDYLISVIYNGSKEPSLKICKIKDGYLEKINDDTNLYLFFKYLNTAAVQWLCSNDDNPFLPAGAGWDGVHSGADLVKKMTVTQKLPYNMDEALRKRVLEAVYFTAKSIADKSPVMVLPSQLLDVKKFQHAVIVYETGECSTLQINELPHPSGLKLDDVAKVILIKFKQLKIAGDEQFDWELYDVYR